MNLHTDFECIRDQVSPEEWQARVALAACYRLVDRYDMADLIYNHITLRIPGTKHLLINLYGLLYKEITASSLAKIDEDGNILSKPDCDYGINRSGFVIHGAIHQARPDVRCIIHTHTRAGMAVSSMQCGLLPMTQTGMRFVGPWATTTMRGLRSIWLSVSAWSATWVNTAPWCCATTACSPAGPVWERRSICFTTWSWRAAPKWMRWPRKPH